MTGALPLLLADTDWIRFTGRLHPVVLHLPIGLIAAVCLAEVLSLKNDGSVRVRRALACIAALSAAVAALSGWLLAAESGDGGATVGWHRWLGIALAVLCVLAAGLDLASKAGVRRLTWLVALAVTVVTGHLGGTMTHGHDHLAEYAPPWMQAVIGAPRTPVETGEVTAEGALTAHEVLRANCVECHGPDKQKAGLRLDTADGIGDVIVPGDAPASELFRRVTLPAAHEDAMPPRDGPLDDTEIVALMHWINAGAPMEAIEADEAAVQDAQARNAATLDALRAATGALVVPVGRSDQGPLRVEFAPRSVPDRAALEALVPVADRLVELSLAGQPISDDVLTGLPVCPSLKRLHLERTPTGDVTVATLATKAPVLAYLNLHSTSVTDGVFAHLESMPALERVVLYGTAVTPGALDSFAAARPDVHATGDLALAPAFSESQPRRILAADASKQRIALLREVAIGSTDVLWEHAIEQIHDLQWLGDGRVLFQETWTRLVEVDTTTGAMTWTYDAATMNRPPDDGAVEVHAFRRLDDGETTMIAESGPARIIEVDRDGRLLHEIPLVVDDPHVHHDTRLVRPTSDGTYLVAHERDGVVREYNRSGTVVWTYDVPLFDRERAAGHGFDAWGDQVFAALRLDSGNTLISTGNGHGVLEVDRAGTIVWQIGQDDLEGVRLAWVTTVQVLPNGHIVIGNCHAGPEQPQILEITPDREIEWRFRDFEQFGDALSNSWIIE